MKRVYVTAVRAVRGLLRLLGLMGPFDAWARRSRTGRWARSLLAIYDVRELVALDTPWWTFESAELVAAHLAERPGARVFEWGSGASTAWLSRRAREVVAVEHDAAWAEQVRPLAGAGVEVVTVPPVPATAGAGVLSQKPGFEGLDFSDYVAAIDQQDGVFDLIVIDGRAREACLARAVPHLADDGLIVFDNVDRQRYRDAMAAQPGLEVRWTRGLTPSLPYPTRTALIRRSHPA
ncbi:putative O-methyltransferase YrrM [Nocardioides sp. BE266]|uniref:class I SAM-dependent methyltransferase n=1 Tax=Nocardioides sp. BE266 TaxID=2817725 RepID=UPI002863D332|nr:class I SAM-dependent methyltransferase [Nocardioides sp. BE266]MDR7253783.1 putative O-methyltransferase YrrM [Nocardioides sp. BE266]